MATKKKLLQAAAGTAAAGGAGLNVEEVFSTYVYEGTGGALTVNNGIDLSNEGGLVWTKNREDSRNHVLFDTERTNGEDYSLFTNTTDPESENSAFNFVPTSTGYTFNNNDDTNKSGFDFVGWTFRKAPKFFDVVTYTGNGVAGRQISHNLGAEVGMMIIKSTSISNSNWVVYHRSNANTEFMYLNGTVAKSSALDWFNSTTPTTTAFTVNNYTKINGSGETFVAYLFAHNDGDGEFGPDGDADIIKCGSYTGTSSSPGAEVDLGFEPQFVMIKRATGGTGPWIMLDNMRGIVTGGNDAPLQAESSAVEGTDNRIFLTPTGFRIEVTSSFTNNSGDTYIYIAIRRGPMAVPESATDVFDIAFDGALDNNEPYIRTSLSYVDAVINNSRSNPSNYHRLGSRLTQGSYLNTNSSSAETSDAFYKYDYQNGWYGTAASNSINTNGISHMWKRAPNYFDVVAYTGTGSARTVSHNLGVAPEMIWVKSRSNAENWQVGHKDLTGTWNRIVYLNISSAESASNAVWWNNTAPTSEVFSVGTQDMNNGSGLTYIAYLFASLDGVSKVGSFSHTNGGGDTNVDCGFSSGARFVLYKQYDSSGSWYVLDSTRGIVAGNDPALLLNSTAAEDSSYDQIDPYSSGFTIPSDGVGTGDYIFYAIA